LVCDQLLELAIGDFDPRIGLDRLHAIEQDQDDQARQNERQPLRHVHHDRAPQATNALLTSSPGYHVDESFDEHRETALTCIKGSIDCTPLRRCQARALLD
jgi:hypothetical protein